MNYRMTIATTTHPGLTGRANEDALLGIGGPYAGAAIQGAMNHHCDIGDNWLVAVADGMGGANAGEVASLMVVEHLFAFRPNQFADVAAVLLEIHRKIIQSGRENPQWAGMGAAVAGIGTTDDGIFVFNVGDCAVYRVVDKLLQRLTVDDSLATLLAMPGIIPEGPRLRGENRLTQVLGGPDSGQPIAPHVSTVRLNSPARFLLCTDGLTDMVTLGDMEALVADGAPSDAVQALLSAALNGGGIDNITVMVMDLSSNDTVSKL